MKTVGIIGAYDSTFTELGGQLDRTEIILNELNLILGKDEVIFVNTFNWKDNIFKLLLNCLTIMRKCENIVFISSKEGTRIFAYLLIFLNKIYYRKVYYIAIGGGTLPGFFQNNPKLCSKIKQFEGVFVETYGLVNKFKSMGISNIYYFPNCKMVKQLNLEVDYDHFNMPYKFCTYSRIVKEKGIQDAIKAIVDVNTKMGNIVCTLDIYGKIGKKYEQEFQKIMSKVPDYIKYKGRIPRQESMEVLKKYLALLFPTQHLGEGLPGGILDAYEAGVPVIASDIAYNSEIILNGKTGIIYSLDEANALKNILIRVISSPQEILKMKKNCLIEIRKYDQKEVIKTFVKHLKLI